MSKIITHKKEHIGLLKPLQTTSKVKHLTECQVTCHPFSLAMQRITQRVILICGKWYVVSIQRTAIKDR